MYIIFHNKLSTYEHAVRYLALSSIASNYFKKQDTLKVARHKTSQSDSVWQCLTVFDSVWQQSLLVSAGMIDQIDI